MLNFILRGLFDQRMLNGGRVGQKSPPSLHAVTSEPKIVETPKVACNLVFNKIFLAKFAM